MICTMACACLDIIRIGRRLRDNYAFSFIPIKSTRLINFFTHNKRVVLRVVVPDRPLPLRGFDPHLPANKKGQEKCVSPCLVEIKGLAPQTSLLSRLSRKQSFRRLFGRLVVGK